MAHIKITFFDTNDETSAMLVALLADAGYEGFEEQDDRLIAYMPEAGFDRALLNELIAPLALSFGMEKVEEQNWNALWEADFKPVILPGFCAVRAHFHEAVQGVQYDIVVTPKMSFGTGHHATTQLMMTVMRDLELGGRTVIDFGTGTGVLAILAEMLGAAAVSAVDNDEWSVENAAENVERNQCQRIKVYKGSLEDVPEGRADVVLANINRHILLEYMVAMFGRVDVGGRLLLSGLLVADEVIVRQAAETAGFRHEETRELNGWIGMLFERGA